MDRHGCLRGTNYDQVEEIRAHPDSNATIYSHHRAAITTTTLRPAQRALHHRHRQLRTGRWRYFLRERRGPRLFWHDSLVWMGWRLRRPSRAHHHTRRRVERPTSTSGQWTSRHPSTSSYHGRNSYTSEEATSARKGEALTKTRFLHGSRSTISRVIIKPQESRWYGHVPQDFYFTISCRCQLFGHSWVALATAGRKIYSVVLEYKTWKILVSRLRSGLVISYFVKCSTKCST